MLISNKQPINLPKYSSRQFIIPPLIQEYYLILSCLILSLLGLTFIASASIHIADKLFNEPLYYFWKQFNYLAIGISIAIFSLKIPLRFWQMISVSLLFLSLFLLFIVLIPGIGKEINGSMRWIVFSQINFQPSEFVKLFIILYLSSYLVRRSNEIQESLSGFLNPVALVSLIAGLLLLEPDYGTVIVFFATVLSLLFLAGVPIKQFLLWIVIVSVVLIVLLLLAPYRWERLTSFINPWSDPFNSGFQLTQALIAIGSGGLFGVGLGNSVQKLTYLPEAHTDFLFAILAEELGLIGVVTVIGLFGLVIFRVFRIAIRAERIALYFESYLAYGIGLMIGLQAVINLGVNMGLLPTKGLTLPLVSYGGSSLVITWLMIGLSLRIDYETRQKVLNTRQPGTEW